MLIRVYYKKGYYDFVKPEILNRMLEAEEIDKFYRQSGEVIVGVDAIRSAQPKKPYIGPERRQSLMSWIHKASVV